MRLHRPLACLVFLAALAASSGTPAGAQDVAAVSTLLGPLVNHVGTDRATLWVRTSPAANEASVQVGAGAERKVTLEQRGRGFALLEVDGLAPDAPHEVRVAVEGGPAGVVRFRTAPPPRAWGRLRFAVGSCAGRARQPIWDQVAAVDPDLFLWLGDNVYYRPRRGGGADWDSVETMLEVQLRGRTLPGVLRVMQSMACYAIWDDHDYGPNDCDGAWEKKTESRLVHRMLWGNPGCGEDEQGIYFSFRRGPVEFFCLDDRFFKDVMRFPPQQRRLYGQRQLEWLKRGLLASDAPLKVIAGGVQQLAGYPLAESWAQADAERRAFLAWLAGQEGCPRVLFLSGDVHVCELYHLPVGGGRMAWELTSSGLAQENPFREMFTLARPPGRQWIAPEPEAFCLVEVDVPQDGPLEAGTLRFFCIGADGGVRASTETTLGEGFRAKQR